jgi:hypothetical protein
MCLKLNVQKDDRYVFEGYFQTCRKPEHNCVSGAEHGAGTLAKLWRLIQGFEA